MRPTVEAINALGPDLERVSDAALRAKTDEFRKRLADGAPAGRPPRRGLRGVPRGRAAHRPDAALRRPAHGRHGAAPGQDRRDGDRRGQDARRDPAGLPERAAGARHAHRHRQRLPRASRCAVDGPDLPRARAEPGRDPARGVVSLRSDARLARHSAGGSPGLHAARGLPRRHHLRHQQRVRLRLPPRQHALQPSRTWSSASTTTRSSTRSTPS